MQITNNPLINQLDNIISKTQLDDVKQIVSSLININNFKFSITDNTNIDFFYTQISKFLKNEFNIKHFKIIESINNIETIQYQIGDESFFNYTVNYPFLINLYNSNFNLKFS